MSFQFEYSNKALILWKMQYYVENEEVEKMKNLTRLLLTNILPQHVAIYYQNQQGEGVCVYWSPQHHCQHIRSLKIFVILGLVPREL